MISNNPFEVHGIEHLSISKLNLWVNDPAKFIATYLCDMKSTVGVGAFRGTSVDYAINEKLKLDTFPDTTGRPTGQGYGAARKGPSVVKMNRGGPAKNKITPVPMPARMRNR